MNEKIRLLRERLRSLKMEGMIVTNPVSIKYLTNIEDEGTLLITRKENIFLTYTMFLENVKNTLTINDEIIVADFRDISKDEYENFFLFCENIGFEENYVTYKQYYYLKQKYRVNNLAETENIVEKLRAVKDKDEIENIKKACELCVEAKADYVKTSTGFSTRGATIEDVQIMKAAVHGKAKVKAAGGVRTHEDMVKIVEAGADRIGTSAGCSLVEK
mgnify:CR=1 FL=1